MNSKDDTINITDKDKLAKHMSELGKKGGLWKTTKDGRSRSEKKKKRRITLIPPKILKD